MIWAFLFAVLFVVFTQEDFYRMSWGFLERCCDTFFLVVFTAIAFGVGIGFASFIGLVVPKQWTGPETTKLVSLRNNDGISGHFFLGSGSIETKQYYFFYKEAERGGYRPGKIEVADNVIVYEEKQQNGQLKVYTYQFSKPAYYWFAFKIPSYRYEFVIPEGSLKQNFVLR